MEFPASKKIKSFEFHNRTSFQNTMDWAVDAFISRIWHQLATRLDTIPINKLSGHPTSKSFAKHCSRKPEHLRCSNIEVEKILAIDAICGSIEDLLPSFLCNYPSLVFHHPFFEMLRFPYAAPEELENILKPVFPFLEQIFFHVDEKDDITNTRYLRLKPQSIYKITSLDALAYYIYLMRKNPKCYDKISGLPIHYFVLNTFLLLFSFPKRAYITHGLFQLINLFSYQPNNSKETPEYKKAFSNEFIYKSLETNDIQYSYQRFRTLANRNRMMFTEPDIDQEILLDHQLLQQARKWHVTFPHKALERHFLFMCDKLGREQVLHIFKEENLRLEGAKNNPINNKLVRENIYENLPFSLEPLPIRNTVFFNLSL